MNRKIWKALGIAVCMLALAAPRAMAERHEVWNDTDFKKAVQEINAAGDEKNEIVLMKDITLGGNPTEYTLYILSCGNTTIKGGGNKIIISNAGITVTGGKTVLNLGAEGYDGTLTIDGNVSGAFITVSGRATANMYENVTLQNRKFAGNAYVLVTGSDPVTGSKSVFNMNGGVIEGGSRAVIAQSGATFNMSGGEIRNCKGDSGGGVRVYEATFVMSGGTISGCTANEGGGLCAEKSSTVTISGGVISGCKEIGAGGGLYVVGSTLNIKGGIISECSAVDGGGGLYAKNKSTINISGGIISGCEGLLGGGLYANNSTVTITDGTISRCNVGAGGGLYATNSSKITIRGGTISECSTTLDSGKGGGLYAEDSTITISGGRIENNKATHGGGVALTKSTVKKDEQPIRNWTVVGNKAYKTGGGIWLGENVKWDISDRTKQIYNNQAIEHGADICLERSNSAIKLPIAANMCHDSSINIDNWYKDDNPRHKPSESGEVVEANKWLNGGLSLVASYTVIPVRIEIDANGGVGGSGSQTVQKGTTVTLEAPTKEGYLFTGWEDENKKIYPAGEDGKVHITVTEDMTLTAVWEARSFTVTYVLLNGETRTKTVNYGQTVTLGEEPRTGYTFVGWKDGENVYRAGETITVTEDKTLTAVWEARSFTVTYVLLNGETRTKTVNYGQTVTLGEEPRTGYTFVGWKDGEKVYHAGETITVTGDMTLTAEWKKLPSAENLPKTGDESPVLLWGAALAVSAAACFVLRRKK